MKQSKPAKRRGNPGMMSFATPMMAKEAIEEVAKDYELMPAEAQTWLVIKGYNRLATEEEVRKKRQAAKRAAARKKAPKRKAA